MFASIDDDGRAELVSLRSPGAGASRRPAVTALDIPEPAGPLGLAVDTDRPEPLPLQLEPGDRLLFFTDGLAEARDRDGNFLDLRGSSSTWAPVPSTTPCRACWRRLHAAADHIDDDLALLLVEYGAPLTTETRGRRAVLTRAVAPAPGSGPTRPCERSWPGGRRGPAPSSPASRRLRKRRRGCGRPRPAWKNDLSAAASRGSRRWIASASSPGRPGRLVTVALDRRRDQQAEVAEGVDVVGDRRPVDLHQHLAPLPFVEVRVGGDRRDRRPDQGSPADELARTGRQVAWTTS